MSDKYEKNNYLSLNNLTKKNVAHDIGQDINTEKSKVTNNENEKNERASPGFKKWYAEIINSFKTNNKKTIKIVFLVIILCVVAVLYFNISYMDKPKENKVSKFNYITSLEYAELLEIKLENLLSKIRGAKDAKVMVYLDGSLELILAEKVDEKTNSTSSGGSSNSYVTTISEPIILASGTPLVITEKLPKIKGVVVVCKGASDVMVKMDIIAAVRTVFDIPHANIEVFAGS